MIEANEIIFSTSEQILERKIRRKKSTLIYLRALSALEHGSAQS